MVDHRGLSHGRSTRLRSLALLRIALLRLRPAQLLLLGYLTYIALGWLLLSLPVSQAVPVTALDSLFIAASAVSTTGLVSLDPGSSFTLAGEVVILLLIQIGGLGYMTISSFAVLALQHRLTGLRTKATRAAFSLPEEISPAAFVRAVVLFTLVCESLGAVLLWRIFAAAGVEDPVWAAVFHAVSAFCTAGFSLFSDSLEGFRADAWLTIVIGALSLLGAMGFLIFVDAWRTLTGKARHLGFSSKVIVRMTLLLLAGGTLALFLADPGIAALPASERLTAAFFQAMSATTTVGFNTHPVSALAPAVLVVLLVLMAVGASPAGTGGGLKTTTFAALMGLVRSTLKGRESVRFFRREVTPERLQVATSSFVFYMLLLAGALFLLLLTETGAAFDVVLFEVVSAMGTVGLSTGLTGQLSELGKLVVIVLMIAGRVGILTFGVAIATRDETREERADNRLVL